VKATDDRATIGKVDMVISSVKLREGNGREAEPPVAGPDTGVISLQNGVTKDEMLAPIVGRQHLLDGSYIAVSIARPGVPRCKRREGARARYSGLGAKQKTCTRDELFSFWGRSGSPALTRSFYYGAALLTP